MATFTLSTKNRRHRWPVRCRGRGPTRTPAELFADYCATVGVDDARVEALFRKLHDEIASGPRPAPAGPSVVRDSPTSSRVGDDPTLMSVSHR